jgi:NAD(P)-dependent dehydrogenase (short-subunit alcohol dehydrogenase family)
VKQVSLGTRLEHKTTLVTGATSNIGRTIAAALSWSAMSHHRDC